MEPLTIRVGHAVLEYLDNGPISKWIGPSLRGLLLHPLKQDWCLLTIEERYQRERQLEAERESRYCLGCKKNPDCRYGRIFESDRELIDAEVQGGRRNGIVALTIGGRSAMVEGKIENNLAGRFAQIRLMAVGGIAIANVDEALKKLSRLGAEQGIAPDRSRVGTRFRILGESLDWDDHKLIPKVIPCTLDTIPGLCSVLVEFDSPLMFKEKTIGNSKRYSDELNFASFFSHCHRTVRRAIQELHSPQWSEDCNFQAFFDLVPFVTIDRVEQSIEEFRRRSNRQNCEPWDLTGITGKYKLTRVPQAFVPWMKWAGLLGIGDSRNCGMGCFRIQVL